MEAVLVALVLIELFVKNDYLLLISDLFALVEGLFKHDTVTFVFKLAILVIVND